jgi:hypothetical protein
VPPGSVGSTDVDDPGGVRQRGGEGVELRTGRCHAVVGLHHRSAAAPSCPGKRSASTAAAAELSDPFAV